MHPFAPSAFTDFIATTRCSVPWCRIHTFALVVQSTCGFSVGIDTEGSHVPRNRPHDVINVPPFNHNVHHHELLTRSSLWQFEVSSYKVTPKGRLSFISRTARRFRVVMTQHHHLP
jgi:hypothetical protein